MAEHLVERRLERLPSWWWEQTQQRLAASLEAAVAFAIGRTRVMGGFCVVAATSFVATKETFERLQRVQPLQEEAPRWSMCVAAWFWDVLEEV